MLGGLCGLFAAFAPGFAAAGTIVLTFPEIQNPPGLSVAGPFPQPPLGGGTQFFTIPPHQKIIAAEISGFWGTTTVP